MKNPEATIGNIIDKAGTSYIAYIDADGYPVTKAMLKPRERDGIKTFLFSTNTSSNKVACFRKNPKASIYFVDRRFFRGVSLTGTPAVTATFVRKTSICKPGGYQYETDVKAPLKSYFLMSPFIQRAGPLPSARDAMAAQQRPLSAAIALS